MSSTNKLFKRIYNVNNVKINNIDLFTDYKGVDHLSMTVDLYKRDKCRCPICHKKSPIYDHPKTTRKWRTLDLGSIIAEIEMKPVRIRCNEHGVLLEEVPFAYKDSCFTKDFDLTATYFARNVSTSFVSEYLRISWQTVGRCISRAKEDLEPDIRRRYDGLVNLGVDETSYKKGHSYITVVVNHDTNEVVWLHKGHGKEILSLFFEELSEEQRKSIKAISGDGARWIDWCIEKYVPWSIRCTDSYHVTSWALEALDEVRKEAWHIAQEKVKSSVVANKKYAKGKPRKDDKQREELKQAKDKASEIKGSAYALGKNPEHLTEYQANKLEMIAESEPRLYKAYILKENLRIILHTKDVDAAKILLNEWLSKACRSKIKSFVELSRKIRRHKQHILNTIDLKLSNARIEAINNKIKLIIRKAYGFRNLDNMFNMIYLICSNIQINLPNRVIKKPMVKA